MFKNSDFLTMPKRLNYYQWFKRFIDQNPVDIIDNNFFRDEAWFHLREYFNSQNTQM